MRTRIVLTTCLVYFSVIAEAAYSDIQQLRLQAEAGDAKAQFELGRAYQEGTDVQQNDGLAVQWYRESAGHEYAKAQNSLGVMYSRGLGVNQDKEEAFRWYKRAAKQGLSEACFNVAISYYNGDGVAEDVTLAYAWMMIARNSGDTQIDDALRRIGDELQNRLDPSKLRLAMLYENGDEIPQDLSRALSLYLELAETTSPQPLFAGRVQYKLCELYGAGKGAPPDLMQARSWCKKAAGSGETRAYLVLGRMAELGLSGNQDLNEAAMWYEDAALMRIPDGFISLGKLKLQSASHDDHRKAYFWLYLAQKFKIPGADPLLNDAAAHLSDKETAKEQKRAAAWIAMPLWARDKKIKMH